jgi:hypothetical protein
MPAGVVRAGRRQPVAMRTWFNLNLPKERKQMEPEPPKSRAPDGSLAAGATPQQTVAAAPGERPAATIRYLDRADLDETFADPINNLIFDGQTWRIEFGVTRFDEVKASTSISGRRYPACRLVLSPAAAVDLINRMQQIAAALTQAGVVKAAPRPAGTPPTG